MAIIYHALCLFEPSQYVVSLNVPPDFACHQRNQPPEDHQNNTKFTCSTIFYPLACSGTCLQVCARWYQSWNDIVREITAPQSDSRPCITGTLFWNAMMDEYDGRKGEYGCVCVGACVHARSSLRKFPSFRLSHGIQETTKVDCIINILVIIQNVPKSCSLAVWQKLWLFCQKVAP